jgi:hypothetical protein
VTRHLEAVGLPTRMQQVPGGVGDVDALMAAIKQDKKVTRGTLTFILTRGHRPELHRQGCRRGRGRCLPRRGTGGLSETRPP